jgi:uncharacterized protein YjbI with pentapeptide repeats
VDFRELANGRTVRRPALNLEDLTDEEFTFQGAFDGEDLRIESGEFADVTGDGSLENSLVRAVDLSGSRLGPLELADVRFEDVDLSNASWHSVAIRRAEIIRARGIGLRLFLASASDVYLHGCRLDYGAVHVESAKGPVVFEECTFREATLTGDLSKAVFLDCELEGVEFQATKAAECDLRTSNLLGARGLLSLRGARITAEQAVSAASLIATEAGLVVDD